MVSNTYCVVCFDLLVFVLCLVCGAVQHILCCVFCFVCLRLGHPRLPVSLDCPFLIDSSVSLTFILYSNDHFRFVSIFSELLALHTRVRLSIFSEYLCIQGRQLFIITVPVGRNG